jgi:ADP-ribosylglycohydrolase
MLAAIAGDIVGSPYERHNTKRTDFPLFEPGCRFTDDSVLTVATAAAILGDRNYRAAYREFARAWPDRGYGSGFRRWAWSDRDEGRWSAGNGAAMRVSPVGLAFGTLEEVLAEAERSALASHRHPEAVRGAQSVAASVFLARTGAGREEIRVYVTATFGYRLDRTIAALRPDYRRSCSCQGSVPEAITAALEGKGWEEAVRLAVSLGGDSDTIACIAGSIAGAFPGGLPKWVGEQALGMLDERLAGVVRAFCARFG